MLRCSMVNECGVICFCQELNGHTVNINQKYISYLNKAQLLALIL